MKNSEFINKLIKLKPNLEEVYESGVSKEFALDFCSKFNIINKSNTDLEENQNINFIKLISSYNLSAIPMGQMSFLINVIENENYLFFIESEGDFIGVNKKTEEIEMINILTRDRVFYCSINSNRFSEFLLAITDYFIKCILIDGFYENEVFKRNFYFKSLRILGGEKYSSFLKNLLIM
jgi:hypothetical protein